MNTHTPYDKKTNIGQDKYKPEKPIKKQKRKGKRETYLDLEYSPSIEGVADVTGKTCKSKSFSTLGNNLKNLV